MSDKELKALREWARVGLALYTAAQAVIAMFYPEHSQTPLNQPLKDTDHAATNPLDPAATREMVEQCDRDAALTLLGHEHPSWWRIKTERADDSPIVQAFAKHRRAALERTAP